jgi:hypothetical protein
LQYVPDTVCSRYNLFPIQFVPIQFVPIQIVPIQSVPIQFVHEPNPTVEKEVRGFEPHTSATWSVTLTTRPLGLHRLAFYIAFQITGINSIKPYIEADPDADAADIVVELMELFGEYHVVLRIVIVDIKGKTRQMADSVIVYMSSTFHKKKATNYLRQFLKVDNEQGFCRGVTVRDCFDLAEQPRARALNRYADHLRGEQQIDGFRILIKQGRAVLQTYTGYQKWTEHTVQPEVLEPYYLAKLQREQQRQEGSSTAALATAPSNITQQAKQATPTRPRGGGQGRGASRGAAKGGRADS